MHIARVNDPTALLNSGRNIVLSNMLPPRTLVIVT